MTSFPVLTQSGQWLASSGLRDRLPRKVAVAWSGGADSTALLLALANQGFELHLWHIDHAWHSQSAEQAADLRRLADEWGLAFDSVRLPAAGGSNREAVARNGRYSALAGLAEKYDIHAVCLGHHREDQAETVCMRMLQGAGARGIRGMKPFSERDGMILYRPLLNLSRSELREALRSANVPWIEDRSNRDTTLWRNRLRHELFPVLKSGGCDPTDLFMRWQRQAQRVAGQLDMETEHVRVVNAEGGCWVEWKQWQGLAPVMRASLLQRMVGELFGLGSVAGRRHIRLVEAWMSSGGSGGLDLSRSRLMRKDGRLWLTK